MIIIILTQRLPRQNSEVLYGLRPHLRTRRTKLLVGEGWLHISSKLLDIKFKQLRERDRRLPKDKSSCQCLFGTVRPSSGSKRKSLDLEDGARILGSKLGKLCVILGGLVGNEGLT